MNSVFLARLLFCAGHIAQCQVLHCELNIVNERKKMMKELQKAGGGGVEDKVGNTYFLAHHHMHHMFRESWKKSWV